MQPVRPNASKNVPRNVPQPVKIDVLVKVCQNFQLTVADRHRFAKKPPVLENGLKAIAATLKEARSERG